MINEKVVANASPLIILFKGGLSELLPRLFSEIAVPNGVCEEIIAGGPSDSAALALPETSWIRRVEIDPVAPEILIWNLGVAESEVLSLALADKSYVAMIDDRAARKRSHLGHSNRRHRRSFGIGQASRTNSLGFCCTTATSRCRFVAFRRDNNFVEGPSRRKELISSKKE